MDSSGSADKERVTANSEIWMGLRPSRSRAEGGRRASKDSVASFDTFDLKLNRTVLRHARVGLGDCSDCGRILSHNFRRRLMRVEAETHSHINEFQAFL